MNFKEAIHGPQMFFENYVFIKKVNTKCQQLMVSISFSFVNSNLRFHPRPVIKGPCLTMLVGSQRVSISENTFEITCIDYVECAI